MSRFRIMPAIRLLSRARCIVLAGLLLHGAAADASSQPQDTPAPNTGSQPALPAPEQLRLAERFAPVLVFHPLEEYFPASPLFAIDLDEAIGSAPAGDDPLAQLGTARTRRDRYRKLTLEEKARLATVYYRAFPARRGSRDVIVVEYWLYYVQNSYRVRASFLPFWISGSHPNDLEHIHVVLHADADAGLVLEEVWASSHQGIVPANRYRRREGDVPFLERGQYLVERGSHALAPDVDGDGTFTPGLDGNSGYRVLWGIRDRGVAGMRYNPSYLDERRQTASVVFAHEGYAGGAEEPLGYRLVPVEELSDAFDELNLTASERKRSFEVPRHWFRRAFGSDNGSSGKLLVPPARDPRSTSIGISHIAATERGFLVGSIVRLPEQGVFVGARYAHLHGMRYVPDLMVEVDAIQTTRRGYLSAQFLFSHPIDATTKIMAGRALVTDSWRFDNRQWDWVVTAEFRLGPMRVSGTSRTWGPITQYSKEFRLAYFF